MIEQQTGRHAVTALWVIGGDQPFIAPKDVGVGPGYLIPKWFFTKQLVKGLRGAAAGKSDNETAVALYCCLRGTYKKFGRGPVQGRRVWENMNLGNN